MFIRSTENVDMGIIAFWVISTPSISPTYGEELLLALKVPHGTIIHYICTYSFQNAFKLCAEITEL